MKERKDERKIEKKEERKKGEEGKGGDMKQNSHRGWNKINALLYSVTEVFPLFSFFQM